MSLPVLAPAWLRALWPAPLAIDRAERWRVVLGVGLGLLLAGGLSRVAQPALGLQGGPWLIAPLGASAVLVFGLPASPLAQPWAVVGGNTVAALVGALCAGLLPDPALAGAMAAAAAVAAMLLLRCLHPPGGAVVGHAGQHQQHRVDQHRKQRKLPLRHATEHHQQRHRATRRRYPHAQQAEPPTGATVGAARFTDADIDTVLRRYNQLVDLPRDDLHELLEQAELQAHARALNSLRCSDIMSREPVTVEFGTSLQDAWALLRQHRIKALPVVDRTRRVVGIVTLADFMRAADLDLHQGFDSRLRQLIRATPGTHSTKPEAVGQIMTRKVRVISAPRSLGELLPIFSSTGHHHIPVIGEGERLVGIVTQTDLVRALARPDRA